MPPRTYVFASAIVGICMTLRPTGRAVPWVPYQISYVQYGSAPDYANGNRQLLVAAEIVEAVRADGSRAQSTTYYRLNRSIESRMRVLELAGGVRIRANEAVRLMTATRDPAADAARARQALDPASSCTASFDGGRMSVAPLVTQEALSGYDTYKIVYDMKLARRTVWRAPALGCAELRDLFEKIDPQSRQVIAVGDKVAVDIRKGDPDPALFELPAGSRNVSPSELAIAAAANCCNAKLGDRELAAMESADKHFAKFRFDP